MVHICLRCFCVAFATIFRILLNSFGENFSSHFNIFHNLMAMKVSQIHIYFFLFDHLLVYNFAIFRFVSSRRGMITKSLFKIYFTTKTNGVNIWNKLKWLKLYEKILTKLFLLKTSQIIDIIDWIKFYLKRENSI